MHDQLQRLAQSRSALHRYVVVLAVMLERLLALEDGAHDLNVLTSPSEQLSVDDSMPAFDDLRARGSYPQHEAAAGQQVNGCGGHRGHRRCPRRHLHDRGPDVDPLRMSRK